MGTGATASLARRPRVTDDDDIEAFYRTMQPRLWGYLRVTTGRVDLADEVTQEAFVRLLSAHAMPAAWEQRTAYLFRVAQNLVRDHGRARMRWRLEPIDERTAAANPAEPDPMIARTGAALASLSERDRRLLWLTSVEGWSHRDVAALLGLANGSVRVLLHRLRRRLRHQLDESQEPDD